MIKGKTSSGIAYKVDESVVEDMRLVYYVSKMESDKTSDTEKMDALFGLLKFIFGGENGMSAFMDAVAKTNGKCTSEAMIKELKEIFTALNAKNS